MWKEKKKKKEEEEIKAGRRKGIPVSRKAAVAGVAEVGDASTAVATAACCWKASRNTSICSRRFSSWRTRAACADELGLAVRV